MIVAIDFDGTIVTHVYPDVGEEVPGALDWLHRFEEEGIKIILWTMRSFRHWNAKAIDNNRPDPLTEAVDYLEKNGINLFGINENPQQLIWTDSPKVYANLSIDDAAVGCPLIYPTDGSRAYVDWDRVGPAVMAYLEQFRGLEERYNS